MANLPRNRLESPAGRGLPGRGLRRWLSWAAVVAAFPAFGQEISLLAGAGHDLESATQSYAWQVGFSQPVGERLAISVGWLNEGHFEGHHRDGCAVQLWAQPWRAEGPFSLHLGAGVYSLCDTTTAGEGYRNQHGLRALLSLQLRYRFGDERWAGLFTLNRAALRGEPRTAAVLLGLGCRLHPEGGAAGKPGPRAGEGAYEAFLVYAGTAIMNSFQSETGPACSAEYRRTSPSGWAWSASYMSGGDPDQFRREGLSLQGWAVATAARGRFEAGIGAGPYLTCTRSGAGSANPGSSVQLCGRVTLGLGWRFGGAWTARLHWNRTLTTYDRDTDVLLLGLGRIW